MGHLTVSTKGFDLTKWHEGNYQRSNINSHSLKVIAREKDSTKSRPSVITGDRCLIAILLMKITRQQVHKET
jgi:hypothetical protein